MFYDLFCLKDQSTTISDYVVHASIFDPDQPHKVTAKTHVPGSFVCRILTISKHVILPA